MGEPQWLNHRGGSGAAGGVASGPDGPPPPPEPMPLSPALRRTTSMTVESVVAFIEQRGDPSVQFVIPAIRKCEIDGEVFCSCTHREIIDLLVAELNEEISGVRLVKLSALFVKLRGMAGGTGESTQPPGNPARGFARHRGHVRTHRPILRALTRPGVAC